MDHELDIVDWQVTLKEKIPLNKVDTMIKQLNITHEVTIIDTNDYIKYVFQSNETEIITETYELIIEHTNGEIAHFSAVLEGFLWDEKIFKNYEKKIHLLHKNYFSQFSRKYVWLNAKKDAIIKDVDYSSHILGDLGVQQISTQLDTEQHSTYERIVYGYSPRWKETIQMDGELQNIQMVLKKLDNNEMKLMIGTPILLNEY